MYFFNIASLTGLKHLEDYFGFYQHLVPLGVSRRDNMLVKWQI